MNVTIYLHNGSSFIANVPEYNASTFAGQLNDPKLLMLAVGNVVVNKNTVQLIAPTPAPTTETTV